MWRHALSLVLLSGCVVVRGSGIPDEELRDVGPFCEVSNTTSLDVGITVAPDLEQEVVVSCDDNLLEHVITRVEGDRLVIRTETGVSIAPRAVCEVEIASDTLCATDNTGSGNLVADGTLTGFCAASNTGSGSSDLRGIDTPALDLQNTGSGDLGAEGVATDVEIANTGSGDVLAAGLSAVTARVRNTGSGEVELTATQSAEVTITGSGDVSLWGGAQVDLTDTGSGDLRTP